MFSASRAWNGKPEAAAARPWVHSLCLMPCASPEQSHAPAAGSAMAQHHGNLILELTSSSSSPPWKCLPHSQAPCTSHFTTPQAPPHTKKKREEDSPTKYHDEVHDIPTIAEVRALMEDEPQGHDFDPSFEAKDPNEIGFCLLLRDEQRCW